MGWLDQFEDWPPYRRLWEQWGGRPWTHIVRDYLGRWPGINVYGFAMLSIGLWLGGWGPGAALATAGVLLLVALISGHLWV